MSNFSRVVPTVNGWYWVRNMRTGELFCAEFNNQMILCPEAVAPPSSFSFGPRIVPPGRTPDVIGHYLDRESPVCLNCDDIQGITKVKFCPKGCYRVVTCESRPLGIRVEDLVAAAHPRCSCCHGRGYVPCSCS